MFWELKSKSCYRGIQLVKQDQRNHYRITYQLSNRKKRSSPLHHHPNKKEENLTCSSLPRHQCPEVRFSFWKLRLVPWINTNTKYRLLMEAFFHSFFVWEGGKIIEKTMVDLWSRMEKNTSHCFGHKNSFSFVLYG